MNNAKTLSLIEGGLWPTMRMLEMCENASTLCDDYPRRSVLVSAFIKTWRSANPLATNQDLIDVVVHSSISVIADTLNVVASELSRDDFEYAFQKLPHNGDLVLTAAGSGKYTQDEILAFGERFGRNRGLVTNVLWTWLANSNHLDADGLYQVAIRDEAGQSSTEEGFAEMKKLAILVLSKKKLNTEQVMAICKKFDSFNVSLAAVKTGALSDDQVMSLRPRTFANQKVFWNAAVEPLHLKDRTVADLFALGRKAQSEVLQQIVQGIIFKKAVRA